MLLEVIAPLTSSECLCCSSTMHSEQTVVEVYIVGPWVFCCCFFCVWKILISLPHVHFVLRITLEVWKWAPFLTTRQLVKTEINIRMKMAGVCVCQLALSVLSCLLRDFFIRSRSWWKLVMMNNFRTEQWVRSLKMLAWKKNDLFSHKKRASRNKTFVMTLENKSLLTFPYWIAPMSIEKAWRPTWNYKTLLKLVRVKQ